MPIGLSGMKRLPSTNKFETELSSENLTTSLTNILTYLIVKNMSFHKN